MKRLILFALVCMLLAGCTNSSSSGGSSAGGSSAGRSSSGCSSLAYWYDKVRPLIQRFDDASSLGQSTPRMQLASVIADMQAIRRETQDVVALDCTENAHQALIAYMDQIILAYKKFLAQAEDSEVTAAFKTADNLLQKFTNEVKKISP